MHFFLKAVCGIGYLHLPVLAPTQEILDAFRQSKQGWNLYERDLLRILADRHFEGKASKGLFHHGCLLRSEETPDHCHRHPVAEYLRDPWGNVTTTQLV